MSTYNDDYATCAETFATLRVFTGTISPDAFTVAIGVTPSRTQVSQTRPEGIRDVAAGWFLTSQAKFGSRDLRRHIDYLLDRIEGKADALVSVCRLGGSADIMCYWVTASGQGGPSLLPEQMARLSALNLEIWFDIYTGVSADDHSNGG